jgi:benzoate transport
MTGFQVCAVTICLVINFLDGFDVLAIAFAAPEIAREWSVDSAALGVIFSAGLAGMIVGALFLSPIADRFGRRPLILGCLCIIGAGMLASAAANGIVQLIAARAITGLGVGGMLSSLTTMVAEYSNDRHRRFAISVLQSGYPVGAIIAGIVSVYLLEYFGWRSVFVVGGVLSLLMIPLVLWRLPESVDFLLSRRPADALNRLNRILKRLDQATLDSLPDAEPLAATDGSPRELFSPTYRGRTFAIWLAFVVLMSAFYFVTNWTPKILTDAGLSREAAISGGVLIATGGVIGGLALGWLSGRFSINRIGAIYMAMAVVAMAVFGQLDFVLTSMLPVAFLIGYFLAGSIICLYAIVPELYPAQIRNTGTGWALGIGRLGAVIGPYVAGVLISAGWDRGAYYIALSLPILVSLWAVLWLRTRSS